MLNLAELEQFVAFADNGTLLKVSEELHISQPTLTRSMRHVEEAFGVPLFIHGKNRLELNETGNTAVAYARKLLADERHAVAMVQAFDQNMRTITVASCAPAPLWNLLPRLSSKYPKKTISSNLRPVSDIPSDVMQERCDIGILPYAYTKKDLSCIPFFTEKLSVCVPKDHVLASYRELSFEMLNGYNCLLRNDIGFWLDLCHSKMPSSKFLVQANNFELEELIRTSTLLCFATNYSNPSEGLFENRNIIPLTDKEATVTYHLICRHDKKALITLN